jgi:hypothetical protein
MGGGLGGVVGGLAVFVGLSLCCQVPQESGARNRAGLAFVLLLFGLILLGLAVLPAALSPPQPRVANPADRTEAPFPAAFWFFVGAGLFLLGSHLAHAQFLVDVANGLRKEKLATSCRTYLVAALVANVISVIISRAIPADSVKYAGPPGTLGGYLPALVETVPILLSVLVLLWHLSVLRAVRRAIAREVAQSVEASEADAPVPAS